MSAPSEAPGREAEPGGSPEARSDSTSYPSPGRGRYVLLLLVLLLAGGYAGRVLFVGLRGSAPARALEQCSAVYEREAPAGPQSDPRRSAAALARLQECTADVEQEMDVFVVAGAAVTLALGLLLMRLLPLLLARRAGPLVPAPPGWSDLAAEAARELGLRRAPEVLRGGLRLREAFAYAHHGRARIVLPPGAAGLPPGQRAALIRHETAHVAAGDITLAWLTRGVRWAVLAVLVVPVLHVLVSALPSTGGASSLSSLPAILPGMLWKIFTSPFYLDYGLRAVLLLGTAAVVAAALLRRREYEADLRSVHGRPTEALQALLTDRADSSGRWWHRPFALHPAPARRLAAVRHPHRILRSSVAGTAAVGLLVGMFLPALEAALPQGPHRLLPWGDQLHTAAVPAGLALAAAWGVPLWTGVLAGRAAGRPPGTRRLLLALPAGLLLGLLAQLWATGLVRTTGPFGLWSTLVTVPVAVAGAAGCSLVLARLRAGGRPAGRLTGRDRLVATAVNLALFTGAFWAGRDTALFFHIFGSSPAGGGWTVWWNGFNAAAMFTGRETVVAAALAVLAFLAWRWSVRVGPGGAPAAPGRGVGAAFLPVAVVPAVLGAAVGAIAARWTVPPAERTGGYGLADGLLDLWVISSAGVACLVTLVLLTGSAGLATAVAAAPPASLLVSLAVWGRYLTTWPQPWVALHTLAIRPLALLAVILLTVGLPLASLSARRGPVRRAVALRVAPALSLVIAASLTAVVQRSPELAFAYLNTLDGG
ncbi:M48 family metalloprotease [Streptomyces sp. S07_1.15]|uniref:M48 family metalloprotease n=1 Tax=Streptomyces sp. S07_1.15 TaxID=2873925 RepID=UPI001D148028|nr:M48 family metalloprotease [Streptomyces sp. S07_1.15]MCC3651795.1 M48 family metalloprotease [Streptomyces sp. S07_1.15]